MFSGVFLSHSGGKGTPLCVPEGSYRVLRIRAVWVGVGARGGGCTVCI